ncbi:hypothetical protein EZV62_008043 [Acer yangbiense]|uniref:CCHC-type domain-containing protein n=1 Tax=Acer yangbiense TaxID=1000413 RepID=A0A5C7ICF7_9ROSI|nr:hypothetical protein EZV62_008043 [Acer yangbiense]
MSESDISVLCENLSLADEDEAVLEMAEEVKSDGVGDVDRCLVGKVLSGKKINIEAFKEQLGEVIELPAESRECWGKFMRVKVRIDISKALKRWLKLKLGKSEEVTTLTLKYERLLEFCYTCGKIGHGIRECQDEVARKASITDRSKPRSGSYNSWNSSEKSRSQEASMESEGNGSVSLKQGSRASQMDKRQMVVVSAQSLKMDKIRGTLGTVVDVGSPKLQDMVIDGSGHVTKSVSISVGLSHSEPATSPSLQTNEPVSNPNDPSMEVSPPNVITQPSLSSHPSSTVTVDASKSSLATKKKS